MPGSYRLTVCAAGFAPVAVPGIEIPPAPMPHGSSAHSPVDGGTIVLIPGAVISGRIVDADGEPLAGASIRGAT